MSSDNLDILLAHAIQLVTMIVLIKRSENMKSAAVINISVLLVYSIYFHYNLKYHSSGGLGLLWMFYLIVALGIHWLINLGGLMRIAYLKFKKNTSQGGKIGFSVFP